MESFMASIVWPPISQRGLTMPTKLVYRLEQFWGRVALHQHLTVIAGPTKLAEIGNIELNALIVLRYSGA